MAIIYSYPLADEVTNDSWVLGSEMDNGARIVKNYSVGDLASFTRGFVTLNDVLDNDNVSQIDAKVGGIFLYNSNLSSGLGYPYITGDKNRFNFYNNVDEYYGNLSQDTLSLANAGDDYYLSIQKPAAVVANRTVTFQDANGTIALTDDLLDYVPYTGATGSINIGSNDIYTNGGAKLADDGTVYGTELFLYDSANGDYATLAYSDNIFTLKRPNDVGGSTMINCEDGTFFTLNNGTATAMLVNTLTTSRSYTLPDEDGTIALTKYKVYVAIVTQSGSANPVATVLEDTIKSITITRGGTGQYTINSSGKFTIGKTTFDITPFQGFIKQGAISNPSAISFETRNEAGSNSDGLLTAKKLEIRVYN